MGRPKKQVSFADALDVWLETASEQEIRDAMSTIGVWCKVRKFGFRVRVEPIAQEKIVIREGNSPLDPVTIIDASGRKEDAE